MKYGPSLLIGSVAADGAASPAKPKVMTGREDTSRKDRERERQTERERERERERENALASVLAQYMCVFLLLFLLSWIRSCRKPQLPLLLE